MKREAPRTNKTVSGLTWVWETPISAKQIGVVHDTPAMLGLSSDIFVSG